MSRAFLSRRDMIAGAMALAPAVRFGRAYAAPAMSGRLLVVFLRGAYDALNVVIPTGADFYYEARPTIGLGKPDPVNPQAPLALDSDWSLHPALKNSILPFWRKKQIAFVPFAGTSDVSRSHFETQDTIEMGQPVGARRDYTSGFMARLANVSARQRSSIAFTDQLPLCFRGGTHPIPNLSLANVGKPVNPRQAQLIESMYQNHASLAQSVGEGFQVRDTAFQTLDEEMRASGRGAVTSKGFQLAARRIGILMQSHYNLAFVDVGGWDTHVNQGGLTGALANRIGDFGQGLVAFADAIGPDAWRTTTVVVVSEFGRTFRENGSKGTDHGHGSIYWVLGGGVMGGRMAGEQIALSPRTLNDGRDLPVLTDYRGLIGGIAMRQFGLNADQVGRVFPDAKSVELRLL